MIDLNIVYTENGDSCFDISIEDICELLNVELDEFGVVIVLPLQLLSYIEDKNYPINSIASKTYWAIIISYNSRQSLHYVLEEFMWIE